MQLCTFDKIISRLQEELCVNDRTVLRQRLKIKKTTFSSWKKRKSIPLGAITECWDNYNRNFDLEYVISGTRRFSRSAEKLEEIQKELKNSMAEYDRLEKMYAQAKLRIERIYGSEVANEIFSEEPRLPQEQNHILEATNDTEPQKEGTL